MTKNYEEKLENQNERLRKQLEVTEEELEEKLQNSFEENEYLKELLYVFLQNLDFVVYMEEYKKAYWKDSNFSRKYIITNIMKCAKNPNTKYLMRKGGKETLKHIFDQIGIDYHE